MKNKDYINTEINELKIVESCNEVVSGRSRIYFKCICTCGKLFKSRSENIKSGTTRSCGCKTSKLRAEAIILLDNAAAINKIFNNYKQSASKKKLDFYLSIEQLKELIFKNCFYCDAAPKLSVLSSGHTKHYVYYNGIDRKDNSIGYLIDNCVTCCSDCNRAKSDLDVEDFNAWIKRLVTKSMTMKNKP